MNNNQILTASFLDILFEGRNKDYGAYELRASYPTRVRKALAVAFLLAGACVTAFAVAGRNRSDSDFQRIDNTVHITAIEETPPPEVIPPEPPPPAVEPPQVRSEQFSTIRVVPEEDYDEPPPSVDDLQNARIDLESRDGLDDIGIVQPPPEIAGKGIIEGPRAKAEPEIWTSVEVDAQFPGGMSKWLKFLERNCNGQVASDNGAPEGRYTVVIRFVVDEQGNVSNLVSMTMHGYGMEEEAMRVIRKAAKEKWIPANQNGRAVKAYRSQPITFEVKNEY